ncbi:MAG: alkaline phosphatase family protein [Caulobacteraceae bacterium]
MKKLLLSTAAVLSLAAPSAALADGPLSNVKHIIIVMQENHSFDNYFGALPYAPNSRYHKGNPICSASDHRCVDGLSCSQKGGSLVCSNSNIDVGPPTTVVTSFHSPTRCIVPDLDHGWLASHQELNFSRPNSALANPLSDGFVRVNDATEQHDKGESPTEDSTISYFDQTDIPFYYHLAQTFAISDRQFASVVGPTIPNRFYLMAATSFGHLTTDDAVPPTTGGYKPITGTIFDLLDAHHVSWTDYFEDAPQALEFRLPDSHTLPIATFYAQAFGIGDPLPQVVFIDPDLGAEGTALEDDEHPPTDIQRGQWHVSDVVNAIRSGPYWKDSVIFITYDEHGGFYDHAKPPAANQGGGRTPDGIAPGQCADLSNPPASERPGGGAECATNPISPTDTSVLDAEALCPALKANPTGPYPASCASFDQLGVRVPFIAVSPFSKPGYVSHVARDHTAMLGMIEDRFIGGSPRSHLTGRDLHAASLEDMFDFTNAPSLHAAVGSAGPPAHDCTP